MRNTAAPRASLIKKLRFYIGLLCWHLTLRPAEEALERMEHEHEHYDKS